MSQFDGNGAGRAGISRDNMGAWQCDPSAPETRISLRS